MSETCCVVRVASPLRSYTHGKAQVTANGATLHDILADLDRQFPGMRFRMIDEQNRIREHIRLAINTAMTGNLQHKVNSGDVIHLLCALSGG
ncbi:MAG TPA: MoaD/ThiS family protein [Steroidobacteraceae bacterium]|nr:MoaD/ThiS family protein [Steroidobacteraceae bacterium]